MKSFEVSLLAPLIVTAPNEEAAAEIVLSDLGQYILSREHVRVQPGSLELKDTNNE